MNNQYRQGEAEKEYRSADYYDTDGTGALKSHRVPAALNNQWLRKSSYSAAAHPTARKTGSHSGSSSVTPELTPSKKSSDGDGEASGSRRHIRLPLDVKGLLLKLVLIVGIGVVVTGVVYSMLRSITQSVHREVDATQRSIRLCEKNIAALNADLNEANSRKTVMQFAASLGMTNTNPYEIRIDKDQPLGSGSAGAGQAPNVKD
ncbi:MAG: hypothetical protein IK083_06880 [Abditibacteriota bacterium]|nr:hypothetical protein [Abditibacteriota bacterium]